MLGFRSLCDNYDDVIQLANTKHIRIADISNGKANDDGYRGVHVYFQLSGYHYPIEIQYNTYFDRQLNNWLHKYVYKRNYTINIGFLLRNEYEDSKQEMKRVFGDVEIMCFLIAKRFNHIGCLALQTSHSPHLADFKDKLMNMIGTDEVQLVTISRPSAYGEYEPYHFVENEEEFEKQILSL